MSPQTATLQKWLPLTLQTCAFLAAGWGYALAQEHRITVIEQSIASQNYTIQALAATQHMLVEQVQEIRRTTDKLVLLEELYRKEKR